MRINGIYRSAEPETEPPEPVPARVCGACGGDIWPWEDFGTGEDGQTICTDCAEALWRSLTDPERLRLLGYEPKVEKRSVYR